MEIKTPTATLEGDNIEEILENTGADAYAAQTYTAQTYAAQTWEAQT